MTAKLGLIAGAGELPAIFAREARLLGHSVVAVTFDGDSEQSIIPEADSTHRVGLGQAGKVIGLFHKNGVTEIAMIGKIDKRVIYTNPRFDLRAISILKNLKHRNDDSFMLGITNELEKEGFTIINQTRFLKRLMPGQGLLSARAPDKGESADIEFGMRMAKGIAALDIGQSVIVCGQATLAVEAIEGTDEAIRRGAGIAGKKAVVCKVSKPEQDLRFDVPTVGPTTIETMARFKASALAIEAEKTVVVNMDKMTDLCKKQKIAFVAV